MTKLFNIEPTERDVVFYLETHQKSRIVNKIIKGFQNDEKYIVEDVESFGDSRIFGIRLFSNETEDEIIKDFKTEICGIITNTFPLNYQFDFGSRRLGFTYAFKVYLNESEICFECYTRIKEIRKDGSSVLPEASNQIKN